jgi:hypothetical protein
MDCLHLCGSETENIQSLMEALVSLEIYFYDLEIDGPLLEYIVGINIQAIFDCS